MAIGSVTAYALVQAAVRALYATMLTQETWSSLVQAPDFESVLAALSKTVYESYLDLDAELLTPRRAAYQIKLHLAEVYDKVIRLTPEPGRELLLWLWRLYEVDNLKATLRGAETGAPWDQVLFLLYPKSRYATLSFDTLERMVHSKSVTRAVEYTRDTPYYNTLSHALGRYQIEESLFPLEVALDLEHNRRLWQNIDRLTGMDREQALHIVGRVLEMDNLLWAIRYRLYHHLSEQEIINYTLPFGYQVHDDDIRAIASGEPIAHIIQRIYPDIEGVQHLGKRNQEGLKRLEQALRRRVVEECRSVFSGTPFHIGLPIAYLVLNEYEIRDLTVLIEAKASQLPIVDFTDLLTL